MKHFLIRVSIFISIIFLILTLNYGGLQWFKFIEPKKEDARHLVFKKTRSYNEAKTQELVKLKYEHSQADTGGKKAIESLVRHSFAEYNERQLAPKLKEFVEKIKYGE